MFLAEAEGEIIGVGDQNQLAAQQDVAHHLVPLLCVGEEEEAMQLQEDLRYWQQSPLVPFQAAKRKVNQPSQKPIREQLLSRCELPPALRNWRSHKQIVDLASAQYYNNLMVSVQKTGPTAFQTSPDSSCTLSRSEWQESIAQIRTLWIQHFLSQ